MSTQHTIDTLTKLIEKAQSMLEELKNPVLTREGWASVTPNKHPIPQDTQGRFATRHGCAWNEKEKRDLVRKWLQFTSVQSLALLHRRTEHSIRAEMQSLLGTADVEVVLDAICGPTS